MAQGRSTKIASMMKRIQTSRSIKISLVSEDSVKISAKKDTDAPFCKEEREFFIDKLLV